MSKSPFLHQPDSMDCGATCLAMVAKHYGKSYAIQKLREMCSATRAGVSLLGISDAAEKLGKKESRKNKKYIEIKSIDKFKNKKIANLQDIYGGNYTSASNVDITTGKGTDKDTFTDAGCLVKRVDNPGLWNWLTGDRKVTTYSWGSGGCQGIPVYDSKGNLIRVDWPTPAED